MRALCSDETMSVAGGFDFIDQQDDPFMRDAMDPFGWPSRDFWNRFALSPEGAAVGAVGGGIAGAVAGQLGGAATGALIGIAFGPVGAAIGFFIGRVFGGNVGAAIGGGLGGYLGDRITTPSPGG